MEDLLAVYGQAYDPHFLVVFDERSCVLHSQPVESLLPVLARLGQGNRWRKPTGPGGKEGPICAKTQLACWWPSKRVRAGACSRSRGSAPDLITAAFCKPWRQLTSRPKKRAGA